MKFSLVITLLLSASNLFGYRIYYAEQWYELYHQHLHRYAEDEHQNLTFLEEALKAPFSNPLYALTKIDNELQWERYRYLFKLHANLQIVRTYLQIAIKYDKNKAYFYNAPWRDQNLESLAVAEKYYNRALYFWKESLVWADKANDQRLKWIELSSISHWHNELRLINEGDLNFELIIGRYLEKLHEARDYFMAMDLAPRY